MASKTAIDIEFHFFSWLRRDSSPRSTACHSSALTTRPSVHRWTSKLIWLPVYNRVNPFVCWVILDHAIFLLECRNFFTTSVSFAFRSFLLVCTWENYFQKHKKKKFTFPFLEMAFWPQVCVLFLIRITKTSR